MCGCASSVGREVLVGVDTDRPLAVAGLDRGVEDAGTRAAGGVVDDVRAVVVHRRRRSLAARRVVEAGEVGLLDVRDVDL